MPISPQLISFAMTSLEVDLFLIYVAGAFSFDDRGWKAAPPQKKLECPGSLFTVELRAGRTRPACPPAARATSR
jgi:hypothetical protein